MKSFVILVSLLRYLTASLLENPTDINAKVGDNVRFNCSTKTQESVDWEFKGMGKNAVNVFIGRTGTGGEMSNGFKVKERFSVDMDTTVGQYDLVIKNVTKADEGEYLCSDISHPEYPGSATLVVTPGATLPELCSFAITASIGDEVILEFKNTRRSYNSISLHHLPVLSNSRRQLFHNHRVNDEYALSSRFQVNMNMRSVELVIKNVHDSDAGTYSLGGGGTQDQMQELTVIDVERGSSEVNCDIVNCTVSYSGRCPPEMGWKGPGVDNDTLKLNNVTISGRSVTSVLYLDEIIRDYGFRPFCFVRTNNHRRHSYRTIEEDPTSSKGSNSCIGDSNENQEANANRAILAIVGVITGVTIVVAFLVVFCKRGMQRRDAEIFDQPTHPATSKVEGCLTF